jgi:predicted small secreted protein
MLKRSLLVAVLIGVVLLAGCQTLKGAGEGAKKDLEGAQQVDGWLRDNLW